MQSGAACHLRVAMLMVRVRAHLGGRTKRERDAYPMLIVAWDEKGTASVGKNG